ncbi:PREDICTED: uncharacterized protein LOC104800583 [Tarenaya hassleriana]|uniref:uncharacterized protein LOC104800583 n=1 Tax=Tarenaya hassleriana TaxID=28532 RepID=UPI00053C1A6F|nr:PREDICTED: uncharacterized protein LOC104800583 [Tarenaya hassleriana]
MEIAQTTTIICSLLAIDHGDYCYRVCSRCERVFSGDDGNGGGGGDPYSSSLFCRFCKSKESKLLYRLLMSIATDAEVKTVICFDRAATTLFGCSADEFLTFSNLNPSAASMANRVLEGEMLRMTLTRPHNRNAQHLRVASVVPLRSGFKPVIVTLREIFQRNASPCNHS